MNDYFIIGGVRVPIKGISGGFHVKELPSEDGRPRCVHVIRMIFNWRLCRSVGDCDDAFSFYDRGWCFQGVGLPTVLETIAQAWLWDGADDTRPEGFIKEAIPVP